MELLAVAIAVAAVWRWLAQRSRAAELSQRDDDTMIMCRVEWHDSQCYVYRQDNGEFLGQGEDIDQAVAQMTRRGLEGNWCMPQDMAEKPQQIQP